MEQAVQHHLLMVAAYCPAPGTGNQRHTLHVLHAAIGEIANGNQQILRRVEPNEAEFIQQQAVAAVKVAGNPDVAPCRAVEPLPGHDTVPHRSGCCF